VIKITDRYVKIGDITVDHTVDIKLLKSLLNLEKDKIVPGKEGEEGLIGESLADFIYCMCLARKKLLVNTFIHPSRSFRFDFEIFPP
jgi:hypothetical protein